MNHCITKDLPESERPYEKVLKSGTEALSDAELLAVILRTGTKELTSVQVAQNILLGKEHSLLNIYEYSIEELMAYPGIGKVKAIELKCIAELSIRLSALQRLQNVVMSNSKSVAMYYMERMRHLRTEHVYLAMFDKKGMLIRDKDMFKGSATCSIISARDIFTEAINVGAVNIILLHNHPSGNPYPSEADDEITFKVQKAGELMDIGLLDHIIIGDNTYYSYADEYRI